MKPVILCILDGVGIRKEDYGNAFKEAKNYKLQVDRIRDKNNYYILKLHVNRESNNGNLTDTDKMLVYYGIYDNTNNTIDLVRVGNKDYFRLTNNDFSQLLAVFIQLKMEMSNDTPERVIRIN